MSDLLIAAGPAQAAATIQTEALELLEWPRLAEQVAGFADTALGRRRCRQLPLADSLAESRRLLAETTELLALDGLARFHEHTTRRRVAGCSKRAFAGSYSHDRHYWRWHDGARHCPGLRTGRF